MINVTLTEEEYQTLTLILGFAAGAASSGQSNRWLFHSIFRLANAVHRDDPAWTPYSVPDDEAASGAAE